MNQLAEIIWQRLTGLMPGELKKTELPWLATPFQQLSLLANRRATMIVNRVRLFAFLFAVLTPMWIVVDFLVFKPPLWWQLALMRLSASAAFTCLVLFYRPRGNLLDAYRAMALLFAIPTLFYIASYSVLGSHELTGLSAAVSSGYAFLPFVLLAGLSIFPLTLIENLVLASPILVAQLVAAALRWPHLDLPAFLGTFWLLVLITGVSALAGMSQLAFMIALVRQATRDPLTGMFSRSSGEEMLELQLILANRSGAPLAVAFIDLDHFKSINDQYGHEAGDKVLIIMTRHIQACLRRGDMLTRWGGEEFLLIMPNTDLEQAIQALERLREHGLGLRPDGAPVTASIGVAERMGDATEDWRALVELADHRMYYAKQNGRNQVCTSLPAGHDPLAHG